MFSNLVVKSGIEPKIRGYESLVLTIYTISLKQKTRFRGGFEIYTELYQKPQISKTPIDEPNMSCCNSCRFICWFAFISNLINSKMAFASVWIQLYSVFFIKSSVIFAQVINFCDLFGILLSSLSPLILSSMLLIKSLSKHL